MANETNASGWVKLYHPDVPGTPCSLPLPALFADGGSVDAGAAFEAVRAYLSAGFVVGDPSLQPGQVRERISQVIRRIKINDDDSETPLIDLFADNAKLVHKRFSRYLNTADEVSEFEAHTGLIVANIPLYNSKTAASREDRDFARFAVTLPAPVEIVLAPNPYYEEGAMKPKHVWVGFAGAPQPAQPKPAPDLPAAGKQPAPHVWTETEYEKLKWESAQAGVTDLAGLLNVSRVSEYAPGPEKALELVRAHAAAKAGAK